MIETKTHNARGNEMEKAICKQCKACKMMTEYGCADDGEKEELENGKCLEFFESGTISNPLPIDLTSCEEDIYM